MYISLQTNENLFIDNAFLIIKKIPQAVQKVMVITLEVLSRIKDRTNTLQEISKIGTFTIQAIAFAIPSVLSSPLLPVFMNVDNLIDALGILNASLDIVKGNINRETLSFFLACSGGLVLFLEDMKLLQLAQIAQATGPKVIASLVTISKIGMAALISVSFGYGFIAINAFQKILDPQVSREDKISEAFQCVSAAFKTAYFVSVIFHAAPPLLILFGLIASSTCIMGFIYQKRNKIWNAIS